MNTSFEYYYVPICYMTFRPYSTYYDEERKKMTSWEESACYRTRVKDKKELFPGTKYFLLFLQTYKRVPSEEDYVWFCYKRLSSSQKYKNVGLPLNLRLIFKWICDDYKPCFQRAKQEGLTIKQIIERIIASVEIKKRKEIERLEPYKI